MAIEVGKLMELLEKTYNESVSWYEIEMENAIYRGLECIKNSKCYEEKGNFFYCYNEKEDYVIAYIKGGCIEDSYEGILLNSDKASKIRYTQFFDNGNTIVDKLCNMIIDARQRVAEQKFVKTICNEIHATLGGTIKWEEVDLEKENIAEIIDYKESEKIIKCYKKVEGYSYLDIYILVTNGLRSFYYEKSSSDNLSILQPYVSYSLHAGLCSCYNLQKVVELVLNSSAEYRTEKYLNLKASVQEEFKTFSKPESFSEVLKKFVKETRIGHYKWIPVIDLKDLCDEFGIDSHVQMYVCEMLVKNVPQKMFVAVSNSLIYVVYEYIEHHVVYCARTTNAIWERSKTAEQFEESYLMFALYTAVRLSMLQTKSGIRKRKYIELLDDIEHNLDSWKADFYRLSAKIKEERRKKKEIL